MPARPGFSCSDLWLSMASVCRRNEREAPECPPPPTGTPSLSQRETPWLVINRAHARLDCKNNNYYYYIINIIRIRIRVSPQGNQRSRSFFVEPRTGVRARGVDPHSCWASARGRRRARGSAALSRAARAPGTEVPEVLASERGLSRRPQGLGLIRRPLPRPLWQPCGRWPGASRRQTKTAGRRGTGRKASRGLSACAPTCACVCSCACQLARKQGIVTASRAVP